MPSPAGLPGSALAGAGTQHLSAAAIAAPSLPRNHNAQHAGLWLRWAMLVSIVGPALLFCLVAWVSRETTLDEARARLARVAQVAQQHATRVVETNEVISRSVARATDGKSNAELRAQAAALHEMLASFASGMPQMQSIWIWDETGRPVGSSLRADPPATLNVADREYFVWARGARSTGWFVSQPLRSRTTGQTFFDFSKRRFTPDGRFAGVLSVSLRPAYFSTFFAEQVKEEPALAVSLVRADGAIIARFPASELQQLGAGSQLLAQMQAGTAAGELKGMSTVDGRRRSVAFRRVGELPIYAAAAADEDLVLMPWRRSMVVLALFTFPLALGLFGLCWFALRRVRLQQQLAEAHEQEYEQRLKAEEALRHAQKMEALGRLTGGVAHDFNNLLMVVQSSVALARALEKRGKPAGDALAPIERAVANGAQLTRQLLAIARRQPLQVRAVQLAEVLRPLALLMDSTLGSAIRIETALDDDLGAVLLDQAEFELALINICINAKDAMPQGGRIAIRAQAVPRPPEAAAGPDRWACVSVRDEGGGIPPDLLAKVFEPFFTTKPLGKGTGLGLSQVQSFAQSAGGVVRVESEVGKGSTVSLLLPASAEAVQPLAGASPADLPELRGHVLLVEDNTDIARSLTLLLETMGVQVSQYLTAESALDGLRAQAVRPDIVLSDISLGGRLTGVDLAQELARLRPGLPVVLMTGYTDQLERASAQRFTVLPKPISVPELLAALRTALAATDDAAA